MGVETVAADSNGVMDCWTIIARSADIIGFVGFIISVASLVITIITMANTDGIKKFLPEYKRKSEYIQAIDEVIASIRSYENTIKKIPVYIRIRY